MEIPSIVLFHVFSLLDTDELLRISTVCFEWWKIVFKGHFLRNAELFELDLGGTGDLYRFVPLKLFANLTRLTLSSTVVTNSHLQQIVSKASELEYLDISNCSCLDQICIFHAKSALNRLEYVDISGNCGKFTILAVACLCSCESMQTIAAHGYDFSTDELLFLLKTFHSVSSGTIDLETEDGYNALSVISAFEEELYEDFF